METSKNPHWIQGTEPSPEGAENVTGPVEGHGNFGPGQGVHNPAELARLGTSGHVVVSGEDMYRSTDLIPGGDLTDIIRDADTQQ
ncbi:MAG TPA: hypothetical protein VJR27_04100 [Candidatus Saccharimonadales bacterium]|nr:hypothetical protein [Candidatus Saccharimonadales bacterium]